jgi:hypothetical protein
LKPIKPLPHAFVDYALAVGMIAAPWIFGFRKNKKATLTAVGTGVGILKLSLVTRYPLGAAKLVSFPTHGAIESVVAAAAIGAPWALGFSDNKAATITHVIAGAVTLGVVAATDYQATERGEASQDIFETFALSAPEALEALETSEGDLAELERRIAG